MHLYAPGLDGKRSRHHVPGCILCALALRRLDDLRRAIAFRWSTPGGWPSKEYGHVCSPWPSAALTRVRLRCRATTICGRPGRRRTFPMSRQSSSTRDRCGKATARPSNWEWAIVSTAVSFRGLGSACPVPIQIAKCDIKILAPVFTRFVLFPESPRASDPHSYPGNSQHRDSRPPRPGSRIPMPRTCSASNAKSACGAALTEVSG